MGYHHLGFRFAALILLFACAMHPAWAGRKALVIGNAAYAEGRLRNPANDAEDMKRQLRALGFTVTLLQDADKSEMNDGLDRFRADLQADDDALVFYAGHGAQFDKRSYLIPVDAKLQQESDLRFRAVSLEQVLAALEPVRSGLKLVILDACRDNPYGKSFRSATRGLARLPEVVGEAEIWYATKANQVAEDGKERNSPFTRQLLRVLRQPGLNIDAVFRKTHDAVAVATEGKQLPDREGTSKDFTFIKAGNEPNGVPPPGETAPPTDGEDFRESFLSAWIRNIDPGYAANWLLLAFSGLGLVWLFRGFMRRARHKMLEGIEN